MTTAQNFSNLRKIKDERDQHVALSISMQNTLTYINILTKLGLPPIKTMFFVRVSGDNVKDRKYSGIIRLQPTESGKTLVATVRTFESWIKRRRDLDFSVEKIRVFDENNNKIHEIVYDKNVDYDTFLAFVEAKKESEKLS